MKLLVVSAHPDDETLGAGGTILRYKDQGHQVYWLNFTDMSKELYSDKVMEKRTREIEEVKNSYKFDGFYNLEYKTTQLDQYNKSEIISNVSNIIQKMEPDIIILPFDNDVHSDHKIVFETTYACTKTFRYPSIKRILMMEILSETDFSPYNHGFVPNYFIDISHFIDKKIKIANIYDSEIKKPPFPRSIENIRALATYRGSTAGYLYAESFILLKGIE